MDSIREILYPTKQKIVLFLSLYVAGSVVFSLVGYFYGTPPMYWAAPLPVVYEQFLDFAGGTETVIMYQNLLLNSIIWYLAAVTINERRAK